MKNTRMEKIKMIIISLALLVVVNLIATALINGVDVKKIVDVIQVNEKTYAELYENKTVYKEFDSELECAEKYSDAWYKIHEGKKCIEIVDVEEKNELELVLHYSNSDTKELKYNSEVECAETYSNIWYTIFDNIEVVYN